MGSSLQRVCSSPSILEMASSATFKKNKKANNVNRRSWAAAETAENVARDVHPLAEEEQEEISQSQETLKGEQINLDEEEEEEEEESGRKSPPTWDGVNERVNNGEELGPNQSTEDFSALVVVNDPPAFEEAAVTHFEMGREEENEGDVGEHSGETGEELFEQKCEADKEGGQKAEEAHYDASLSGFTPEKEFIGPARDRAATLEAKVAEAAAQFDALAAEQGDEEEDDDDEDAVTVVETDDIIPAAVEEPPGYSSVTPSLPLAKVPSFVCIREVLEDEAQEILPQTVLTAEPVEVELPRIIVTRCSTASSFEESAHSTEDDEAIIAGGISTVSNSDDGEDVFSSDFADPVGGSSCFVTDCLDDDDEDFPDIGEAAEDLDLVSVSTGQEEEEEEDDEEQEYRLEGESQRREERGQEEKLEEEGEVAQEYEEADTVESQPDEDAYDELRQRRLQSQRSRFAPERDVSEDDAETAEFQTRLRQLSVGARSYSEEIDTLAVVDHSRLARSAESAPRAFAGIALAQIDDAGAEGDAAPSITEDELNALRRKRSLERRSTRAPEREVEEEDADIAAVVTRLRHSSGDALWLGGARRKTSVTNRNSLNLEVLDEAAVDEEKSSKSESNELAAQVSREEEDGGERKGKPFRRLFRSLSAGSDLDELRRLTNERPTLRISLGDLLLEQKETRNPAEEVAQKQFLHSPATLRRFQNRSPITASMQAINVLADGVEGLKDKLAAHAGAELFERRRKKSPKRLLKLERSRSWQGFDAAEARRIVRQQAFFENERYGGQVVTDRSLPPPPSTRPPSSSTPSSSSLPSSPRSSSRNRRVENKVSAGKTPTNAETTATATATTTTREQTLRSLLESARSREEEGGVAAAAFEPATPTAVWCLCQRAPRVFRRRKSRQFRRQTSWRGT